MLKPPRLNGIEHLRLFVSFLTIERACKIVDVHPATMRRWLRGSAPIPTAALQALYWLTPWGFSDAFSESHQTHRYLTWRLRQMESDTFNYTVFAPEISANEERWNKLRPRRPQLVK